MTIAIHMKSGSKIVYGIVAGSVLWLVCACAQVSHAQDSKPMPHQVVLLRMLIDADLHQVVDAKIVDSPVPLPLNAVSGAGEINYMVMDEKGNVLVEGGLRDPQLVHSPLSLPGEPQVGHKTASLTQNEYLLRLPYSGEMKYLRLAKGKAPLRATARELKSAISQGIAADGTTTIDLASWLKPAQRP